MSIDTAPTSVTGGQPLECDVQFRLLAEAMPHALWVLDASARLLFANGRWRDYFGVPPEVDRFERWREVVHPDERESVARAWQEAASGAATFRHDCRLRRADGEYRWHEVSAVPFRSPDGSLRGWYGVNSDVHDRKLAERHLHEMQQKLAADLDGATRMLRERADADAEMRESEERYRTLAEAMPHLVWTADSHGVLDYYSRRAELYWGLEAGDQPGGDWRPVVHPDDVGATSQAWASAVEERRTYAFEHRLRMAGGEFRWHLSRATPLLDVNGRVVKWFGTATEIHELRTAKELLRQNNQRKDEFLAMLAHELRNPLAPIRTGLHLLGLTADRPDVVERTRAMMERQVEHMVRLVDDLLDVSRITSGKIQLKLQDVWLADIVRSAVEANQALVAERQLVLRVDLPEEPCALFADPARLVQVVSNLLHNAAKFTKPGGRISLRAGLALSNGGSRHLVLEVADTGAGIAPDVLPRVFDLFAQGEDHARTSGGLGIGLTLARRLTELHGGRITAASDGPGKGSVFTVTLPLDPRPAPDLQEAEPSRVGGARRKRVLIVDDNVDAATSLGLFYEALGAAARTASTGLGALEIAAAFKPDLVLLDIGMPGLDGYETCRRLRRLPTTRDTTIVAVTGWAQEQDRRRAAEAGFNAHLTKPADPKALERLLSI